MIPGSGKQDDGGGTVGDGDSLPGGLAWAQVSEEGPWRSDSWMRTEGWEGMGLARTVGVGGEAWSVQATKQSPLWWDWA